MAWFSKKPPAPDLSLLLPAARRYLAERALREDLLPGGASAPKAPPGARFSLRGRDVDFEEVRRAALLAQADEEHRRHARLGELLPSFSQRLRELAIRDGRTDAHIYKAAGIDRRLYSHIVSTPGYRPSRNTAVALALALRLTPGDAADMLERAGFALSHSSQRDVLLEYCFHDRVYDLQTVNELLPPLASPPWTVGNCRFQNDHFSLRLGYAPPVRSRMGGFFMTKRLLATLLFFLFSFLPSSGTGTVTTTTPPQDGTLYVDEAAGVRFTAPEGWEQTELQHEEAIIPKAKFQDSQDSVASILFGWNDLWTQLPEDTKALFSALGYGLEALNNSFFDEEYVRQNIEEISDGNGGTWEKKILGGQEYIVIRVGIPAPEVNCSMTMRRMICLRDAVFYEYQQGGFSLTDRRFAALEQLVSSAEYR